MVWDTTGGTFNDRNYLVYTDETVNENNDTDIEMRTSTDDGATWTAPVRVNDDATTNSQFLPYVALDPTSGTVAVGFHDCRNDNGVPGPGGTNTIPNDDAEYYGTFTTDGGATWAPNRRLSGECLRQGCPSRHCMWECPARGQSPSRNTRRGGRFVFSL